jgi:hypothetical protein
MHWRLPGAISAQNDQRAGLVQRRTNGQAGRPLEQRKAAEFGDAATLGRHGAGSHLRKGRIYDPYPAHSACGRSASSSEVAGTQYDASAATSDFLLQGLPKGKGVRQLLYLPVLHLPQGAGMCMQRVSMDAFPAAMDGRRTETIRKVRVLNRCKALIYRHSSGFDAERNQF